MRNLLILVCFLAIPLHASADETANTAAAAPAETSASEEEVKPLPPGVVEVQLEDLHCKTCAKKLSRKLYALKGVSKVETYLKTDRVVIRLPKNKPVNPTELWQAVVAGGSQPTEIRYADQRLDTEAMEELLEPTGA